MAARRDRPLEPATGVLTHTPARRRTAMACQPAPRAAAGSSGWSDRNSGRPCSTPSAAAIFRYDGGSFFGPADTVSKNPPISGVRSPAGVCANHERCEATEPEDYTAGRTPARCQDVSAGITPSKQRAPSSPRARPSARIRP